MYCIETSNLSYSFSKEQTILNAINLQVPKGSIYGFLGANGAGKTTTIRLLLGLLKKQQGSIRIFGEDFTTNRIPILRKIGSLIESPSLYSQLTAHENLSIIQKVHQCPINRIDEVLKITGLENTGRKNAGQFSLGMKQRLSIAMALLNEPELLILDEPTNGLDPNGILEMRELLKQLNREKGITILVSSHLLTEVEKLVSHIGVIHKGNLLFQGTLPDLIQQQRKASGIQITTNNANLATQLIAAIGLQSTLEENRVLLAGIENHQIAQINRKLVENGVDVYAISAVNNDLESIFMEMVR